MVIGGGVTILGQCGNEGQQNKLWLELARPWVGISGKFYSFGIPLLPEQHEIDRYFLAFAAGCVLSVIHFGPFRSTPRWGFPQKFLLHPLEDVQYFWRGARTPTKIPRQSFLSALYHGASRRGCSHLGCLVWYFERAHHGTHRVLGY